MSLDKAIKHGKEKRKPYRGSKSISKHCRNNCGCPACESNRMHGVRKQEDRAEYGIKEAMEVSDE